MHGPQTFDVTGTVATFWILRSTKQGLISALSQSSQEKKNACLHMDNGHWPHYYESMQENVLLDRRHNNKTK